MSQGQASELLVVLLFLIAGVHVFTVWLRNRKKRHGEDNSTEVGGSSVPGEQPGVERRSLFSGDGADSGGDGGGGGGGD